MIVEAQKVQGLRIQGLGLGLRFGGWVWGLESGYMVLGLAGFQRLRASYLLAPV